MTDLEIELAKKLLAFVQAEAVALIDKIAAHEAAKAAPAGDPVPKDPAHPTQ